MCATSASLLRPGERAVGDAAPVAEHGEHVGDGAHLLEEVADVDDPDALAAEPPDQREQVLDVVALEAAGRLVHEHDAGARGDGPADLDHLLRGNRQRADRPVRPQLGVREAAEDVERELFGLRAPEEARSCDGSRPSRMFSATVRCGQSDSSW